MEYTRTNSGNVCNVVIKGKIVFSDHNTFKEIFSFFSDNSVRRLELDISGVDFVDSAALGLLLLIRDEAQKTSKEIVIKNPQGQVKKMFEISKFYELFKIV